MLKPSNDKGVDWLIGLYSNRGKLCELTPREIFKVWEGCWNQKCGGDLIQHLVQKYKMANRNSWKPEMTFLEPHQERNATREGQLKHIKPLMKNYCSCQIAYGLVNFMNSYIPKTEEANLKYLKHNIETWGNGYLNTIPDHIDDEAFNDIYAFFQADIKETREVDWLSLLNDYVFIPLSPHNQPVYGNSGKHKILCPFHDGETSPSLEVDWYKKIWRCFGCTAPKNGGQLPTLIMKVTGKFWHQLKPKYLTNKEVIINIPQSITDGSWELIDTEPLQDSHPLVTEHGFDLEFLNEWGVRQASAFDIGNYAMPWFDAEPSETSGIEVSEEVIAYSVRFSPEQAKREDRKFHIPEGFKRSKHLLGIHRIEHNPSLLLVVEGGKDHLRLESFGYKSVGLFSADISDHQLELIRALKPIELCLAFDNDETGRKALITSLSKLITDEFTISFIKLRDEHNDFGDIQDKGVIDLYIRNRSFI